MKKILIAEDDELIAALERDYLEAAEFEVVIASDGFEGMRLATEEEYALILLDVMLPGPSGFDICREVRRNKNTPIIMVTARKEDVDKIRGLGLGADDYIIKPFSPSEMVARVRAHIRIHERLLSEAREPVKTQVIEVGGLKIDTLSHRVFVNGSEVALTNKEYELLCFLASNPNIVFSKDALFDRIWGMDACGDTSTVTVHINRIREKIEDDTANPRYIETVWGAGYRFTIL
ncbi:response regulator transcription factor [Hornefia butyriciproducens]|uniref:Stage 0 sporulation protein A homolog n=1 Tax=Hornefia butyriciproducens TaxID=2652293 RepID=A0A6L5Y7B0_9FIRM|nr:response regulator transcription factor [Hornefia butyriciproducens]MCI7327338.1 response regulator transcription factor [Clostridiales bacterium]MCI7679020.1 response regulator transcription factor [Clostridiales bacterium]MDD6299643.1 response regulator transcription factor [Hornefia butyriciproducens]MDD7020725.1 response regulator transcription factor [Hornefia butyriciproducens]MDY2991694.1 response regulator transcription factor [Hornefia butyriciproducens]